jgi:hypothetical protein
MARGEDTRNHPGRGVSKSDFSNSKGEFLPFHQGRYAAAMGMLPLPSSSKDVNEFAEGYDFQESVMGVPQESRNTNPKGSR